MRSDDDELLQEIVRRVNSLRDEMLALESRLVQLIARVEAELKGQPDELNKCDNGNTDAETKETSKAARDAATPEVPKVQEVHKEKSNLPSCVSKFCWTFSI